MNQTIFITATNTNVGKTYTTQLLIEAFSNMGYKVLAVKPIETGVETHPLDATKLLESVKKHNKMWDSLCIDDICWYTYALPAAPFVAKGDEDIDMKYIIDKINGLKNECDILLVEGAGGLMVPIEADYFMIDLAQEVAHTTLLVAPSKLGSINDTLLSTHALAARNMNYVRAVNVYEDALSYDSVTYPFYAATNGIYTLQEDLQKVCEALLKSST